jgi:xanthine dehydrogenase iron-sulfur cluster and FAD-binding subunit A
MRLLHAGFVMSLYAVQRSGGPTDSASLKDALAGNLCRCTATGRSSRRAR